MEGTFDARHLEDHEILHLVDRNASAWELDRWSRHAIDCEACGDRLVRLQRTSTTVSTMLSELQLPPDFVRPPLPARRRRQARAATSLSRAAAVLVVLLLPVVLVSPLRAWVGDRIGAGWAAVFGGSGAEPGRSSSGTVGEAGAFSVRFEPTSTHLVVRLASTQSGGQLRVRVLGGEEGTITILEGAGETPMISDVAIVVQNRPESVASYELRLPEIIRTLEVSVGDVRAEYRLEPGSELRMDLRLP